MNKIIPIKKFQSESVIIESRHSLDHEVKLMKDSFDAMPLSLKRLISKIWNDSKCGYSYRITVSIFKIDIETCQWIASCFNYQLKLLGSILSEISIYGIDDTEICAFSFDEHDSFGTKI